MDAELIPQEQWNVFFNDLSNRFQGWAVTMEMPSRDTGSQRIAAGQPLVGIGRDSGGPATGAITIMVGDENSLEIHHIQRPRAIRYGTTGLEQQGDLQIEAEDGATTLIRFQQYPDLQQPGRGIQAQP